MLYNNDIVLTGIKFNSIIYSSSRGADVVPTRRVCEICGEKPGTHNRDVYESDWEGGECTRLRCTLWVCEDCGFLIEEGELNE